jgi:hypothetical protein
MTKDQAEALLRRNIVATLGEPRATDLGTLIGSTAEALALVMNVPIELDQECPDFLLPFV